MCRKSPGRDEEARPRIARRRPTPRSRRQWWARRESNPHPLRDKNLNLACLPVSPLALTSRPPAARRTTGSRFHHTAPPAPLSRRPTAAEAREKGWVSFGKRGPREPGARPSPRHVARASRARGPPPAAWPARAGRAALPPPRGPREPGARPSLRHVARASRARGLPSPRGPREPGARPCPLAAGGGNRAPTPRRFALAVRSTGPPVRSGTPQPALGSRGLQGRARGLPSPPAAGTGRTRPADPRGRSETPV
jgi:hypothetical protein